jgi:hypothetical protein
MIDTVIIILVINDTFTEKQKIQLINAELNNLSSLPLSFPLVQLLAALFYQYLNFLILLLLLSLSSNNIIV